ncbi:hypothetical protein D3C75_1137530 [compost metagenome]
MDVAIADSSQGRQAVVDEVIEPQRTGGAAEGAGDQSADHVKGEGEGQGDLQIEGA